MNARFCLCTAARTQSDCDWLVSGQMRGAKSLCARYFCVLTRLKWRASAEKREGAGTASVQLHAPLQKVDGCFLLWLRGGADRFVAGSNSNNTDQHRVVASGALSTRDKKNSTIAAAAARRRRRQLFPPPSQAKKACTHAGQHTLLIHATPQPISTSTTLTLRLAMATRIGVKPATPAALGSAPPASNAAVMASSPTAAAACNGV